jgi:hypothetical protein
MPDEVSNLEQTKTYIIETETNVMKRYKDDSGFKKFLAPALKETGKRDISKEAREI